MDQFLLALVTAVPATILGLLAYRRSRKVDAVAEQSGAATETRAGTAQIIQGLNDLVESLQEDNKVWREDIRYLRERLESITRERDDLRQEVARLRRLYGDNDELRSNDTQRTS